MNMSRFVEVDKMFAYFFKMGEEDKIKDILPEWFDDDGIWAIANNKTKYLELRTRYLLSYTMMLSEQMIAEAA